MKKRYWHFFILTIAIVIVVIINNRLSNQREPEVNEISEIVSPSGKLTAVVQETVYGDHWFVNVPKYEVRLRADKDKSHNSIVYSTDSYGPTELSVQWKADGTLLIQDSSESLSKAVKKTYGNLDIQYIESINRPEEIPKL